VDPNLKISTIQHCLHLLFLHLIICIKWALEGLAGVFVGLMGL